MVSYVSFIIFTKKVVRGKKVSFYKVGIVYKLCSVKYISWNF